MNSSEQTHRFVVRLPIHIRNRIVGAAKYHRRSMNSEIVARLDESFSGPGNKSAEPANTSNTDPAQSEATEKESVTLTEQNLLQAFRQLSEAKRKALLDLMIL